MLTSLDQEVHYREVDDENIKVRQENYMLADEVQEHKKDIAKMEEKLNQYYEQNTELTSAYEQLRVALLLIFS